VSEIILVAREWKARALLRAQLLEEGHEVMALPTIEEAMMLLCRGMVRPRLIILDTVGQSLKEPILADLQALAGDAPILVCTGPFDLARFDFKEAGLTDLLVRPFAIGDVVNAVREILGNEATGNEATRDANERRCSITC
jgi:DNA-binding response OmpR family regulator